MVEGKRDRQKERELDFDKEKRRGGDIQRVHLRAANYDLVK